MKTAADSIIMPLTVLLCRKLTTRAMLPFESMPAFHSWASATPDAGTSTQLVAAKNFRTKPFWDVFKVCFGTTCFGRKHYRFTVYEQMAANDGIPNGDRSDREGWPVAHILQLYWWSTLR